jgi:hypothetical protein
LCSWKMRWAWGARSPFDWPRGLLWGWLLWGWLSACLVAQPWQPSCRASAYC